jgi:hypothetical protein
MSSFDAVNYAIRPNKTVERKIVFSGLIKLREVLPVSSYQYIGLGSLWFVDFIMAHKLLGISSMMSIERDQIGYQRSVFNCPLSCIKVIRGESGLVIPTLELQDVPCLAWLDYDGSVGDSAIGDIGKLVARCAPNSIVIVTLNAKKDELPTMDERGEPITEEESLRRIAGDLVPTPLPQQRLQRANYPKLLCEILMNQLRSATVNSGRRESFIPLFDLAYSDGTPMVTVGGILATAENQANIGQLVDSPDWQGIVSETISIPPLTVKEKLALDRMMPSPKPPTDQQMNKVGFHLKRAQLDMYHRHYLHYPMFGELLS